MASRSLGFKAWIRNVRLSCAEPRKEIRVLKLVGSRLETSFGTSAPVEREKRAPDASDTSFSPNYPRWHTATPFANLIERHSRHRGRIAACQEGGPANEKRAEHMGL